jgi:hypothetical protein
MRLVRMTTRRWMVVVVIVGLLMGVIVGGVRLKQRRSHFLSRAQYHEQRAAFLPKLEKYQRGIAEGFPRHIALFEWRQRRGEPVGSHLEGMKDRLDWARKGLDRLPGKSAYHVAMANKYQHAAHYPWLHVEPEPPEPE